MVENLPGTSGEIEELCCNQRRHAITVFHAASKATLTLEKTRGQDQPSPPNKGPGTAHLTSCSGADTEGVERMERLRGLIERTEEKDGGPGEREGGTVEREEKVRRGRAKRVRRREMREN